MQGTPCEIEDDEATLGRLEAFKTNNDTMVGTHYLPTIQVIVLNAFPDALPPTRRWGA
jgi:hypothetical protein